jgi:hypothetical protein
VTNPVGLSLLDEKLKPGCEQNTTAILEANPVRTMDICRKIGNIILEAKKI